MKKKYTALAASLALCLCLMLSGCTNTVEAAYSGPGLRSNVSESYRSGQTGNTGKTDDASQAENSASTTDSPALPAESAGNTGADSIPAYAGEPYVIINDNIPAFQSTDLVTQSYEYYSDLDELGRCGTAVSCIGQDLMPTEKRGSIGMVKPTGWQTVKYDFVDGKYLYNRCHLIGYQLTAENANEKNLITGTRSLNVDGMLPFENMTADYIKETGNHVLYRVTPLFEGSELVARGVFMEAQSVEDNGAGIQFYVFCYNVQNGVVIDYASGSSTAGDTIASWPDTTMDSSNSSGSTPSGTDLSTGSAASGTAVDPAADGAASDTPSSTEQPPISTGGTQSVSSSYVLNTNTNKFHDPGCSSLSQANGSNLQNYDGTRENLIAQGYSPCKRCNP